jgi:hypothetical protein
MTHAHDRPRRVEESTAGRPLDASRRSFFEARFGTDHHFGEIRVHDDAAAHRLTSARGARAVTVGSDLYFARGAYAPDTPRGSRVLAHELTHSIQQSRADSQLALDDAGAATDALECEARDVGDMAAWGLPIDSGAISPAPSSVVPQHDDPENPLDDASWVSKGLGALGFVPGIGPYAKAARGGWEAFRAGTNAGQGDWSDALLGGAQAVTSTASALAGASGFSMLGSGGLGGLASAIGEGGLGVLGTVGGVQGSALTMEAGAALAGGGGSGLAALGPGAAVAGSLLAGIGAGIGLDHLVDWAGDKISGNEDADHSISGGLASVMTGIDEGATGLLRDVGVLDADAPAYTQTLGWQLAEILPSWLQ